MITGIPPTIRLVVTHLYTCFRFVARELSRVGDVIGQVKAVDKDSVKQTKMFYVIARGNEKGMQQSCYLFVHDFVVKVKTSRAISQNFGVLKVRV